MSQVGQPIHPATVPSGAELKRADLGSCTQITMLAKIVAVVLLGLAVAAPSGQFSLALFAGLAVFVGNCLVL